MRRLMFWSLAAAIAFVLVASGGRSLIDSLLVRMDEAKLVHRDRSSFATGVESEVPRRVVLVYRDEGGRRSRALADAADYSAFMEASFARLEGARVRAAEAVGPIVEAQVSPLEQAAQERVARYADWYFAWPTSYRLLYEAGRSAVHNALAPSLMSLKDTVAADVGRYIRAHYREIVLDPEVTDPLLRQGFAEAYRRTHGAYVNALLDLEQSFQRFVAEKTTHLDDRSPAMAELVEVDWESQLRKLKLSLHDKGGLGALAGAGGIGALAVIGGRSAAAHAGGRMIAGPAARGSVSHLLLGRFSARLAAPVASKAVAATAAAGSGATIGTAAAGPLGAAVGAGAGLLIDVAVTRGVELVAREDFEAEVRGTVAASYAEWRLGMARSLREALDVWFGDAADLLREFEEQAEAAPGLPGRSPQMVRQLPSG